MPRWRNCLSAVFNGSIDWIAGSRFAWLLFSACIPSTWHDSFLYTTSRSRRSASNRVSVAQSRPAISYTIATLTTPGCSTAGKCTIRSAATAASRIFHCWPLPTLASADASSGHDHGRTSSGRSKHFQYSSERSPTASPGTALHAPATQQHGLNFLECCLVLEMLYFIRLGVIS